MRSCSDGSSERQSWPDPGWWHQWQREALPFERSLDQNGQNTEKSCMWKETLCPSKALQNLLVSILRCLLQDLLFHKHQHSNTENFSEFIGFYGSVTRIEQLDPKDIIAIIKPPTFYAILQVSKSYHTGHPIRFHGLGRKAARFKVLVMTFRIFDA